MKRTPDAGMLPVLFGRRLDTTPHALARQEVSGRLQTGRRLAPDESSCRTNYSRRIGRTGGQTGRFTYFPYLRFNCRAYTSRPGERPLCPHVPLQNSSSA